jgi:hypothetical protein
MAADGWASCKGRPAQAGLDHLVDTLCKGRCAEGAGADERVVRKDVLFEKRYLSRSVRGSARTTATCGSAEEMVTCKGGLTQSNTVADWLARRKACPKAAAADKRATRKGGRSKAVLSPTGSRLLQRRHAKVTGVCEWFPAKDPSRRPSWQ